MMRVASLLAHCYVGAAGADDGLFLLQHQVLRHVATPTKESHSRMEQDFNDVVNSDDLSEFMDKLDEDFKGFRPRQPGNLPYYVDGSVPRSSKHKLHMYLQSFNAMDVGIRFVATMDRGIKFYTKGGSSWGPCQASYDDTCDVTCLGWRGLHPQQEKKMINTELAYLVGMFKEHTRSDRDNYLRINWHCVKPGKEWYYEKNPRYQKTGPYDPFSVTHGRIGDYNRCRRYGGQQPLIMMLKNPASVNATSVMNYGSRTGDFSDLDKQYLRSLYSSRPAVGGAERVTQEGCPCMKEWRYPKLGWTVTNYCQEYQGKEICFTDPAKKGPGCRSWGFCA